MSLNSNVTIPPTLYERAKRIAKSQHREIEDVVVEALEQGLPSVESDGDAVPAREIEKDAFQRLHPQLWQTHPKAYVAIKDGKLIDHDADQAEIIRRIDEKYPNSFVLIRQVKEQPEIVYEHRSIRWG